MAISLVAHVAAQRPNGGTTSVTSSAINTTGANFLVATVTDDNNTPSNFSISDSKSNTWTKVTSTLGRCILFYCENATVGTGHTFTFTCSQGTEAGCVAAFSGVAASASLDQSAQANSTDVTSLLTPSVNNCLVITVCGPTNGSTYTTAGTGFTITDVQPLVGFGSYGNGLAYEIQTTATARQASWSPTTGFNCPWIAVFKPIVGQPPNITDTLTDSITFTDNIIFDSGVVQSILNDSIAFTESLLSNLTGVLSGDTLNLLDNLLEDLRLIALVADALSISDSVLDAIGIVFTLNDTLSLSDSEINTPIFSNIISDSISITDSLQVKIFFNSLLTETLNLLDALIASLDSLESVSDSISFNDQALFNLLTQLQATINGDSLNFSDSITTLVTAQSNDYLRRYLNDKIN